MLDLDTFLTTVYVLADEFCQTRPPERRPGPAPSLCRSEVLTLALVSQWGRFPSERAFYRFAQRHLRAAFPTLPDRSQFNRLLRHHQASLAAFALTVTAALSAAPPAYEVLDTVPLPTRTQHRRGRGWLAGIANVGRSLRLGWFTGLRLLVAVAPTGAITGFGLGPASANDRHLAETLFALRQHPDPALPRVGQDAAGAYLADTGFGGYQIVAHWQTTYGALVLCPPQRGSHRVWSRRERRQISGRRQIVETVVAKLLDTFRLRTERPHTLSGLLARLAAKVALHNVCLRLNQQLDRPLLAFADLIDW